MGYPGKYNTGGITRGRLPDEMNWKTMALLSNVEGELRSIGLVEVIWKIFTSTTNSHLRSAITLHNPLHGFKQGRGTETATLEENLSQQLAGIFHKTLFQVFLDAQKAYNVLDQERCMEILKVYGILRKLRRILQRFWKKQAVVP